MTNMEDLIIDYLERNQDGFRESQSSLMKTKKELFAMESVVFHRDISDQYIEKIRSNIVDEICNRLALDYETVISVVEELDLDEYLLEYCIP